VRNTISDVSDAVVRYLTDTEPGSSGAPVFDTAGRLIALHHAGGRPVEVAGKPPVSKNEGIRISRVLERLTANGVVVG
jgi:V8-like Glu-specific endopeptidase